MKGMATAFAMCRCVCVLVLLCNSIKKRQLFSSYALDQASLQSLQVIFLLTRHSVVISESFFSLYQATCVPRPPPPLSAISHFGRPAAIYGRFSFE
jgi:hypothetical protein